MPHINEVFVILGFNEAQVDDFLTLLSIAEQEKEGKTIIIPSHEENLIKLSLLEQAAQHITVERELLELNKKGLAISADLLNNSVSSNDYKVKVLLALNEVCQSKMLRQTGTERQQLKDNDQLEQHRELITKALSNLGFINEVKPTNKTPDVLMVLGSSQSSFTDRLRTTVQYLEEEHIKPSGIYLLGGQRPLWAVHEPVVAELIAERIYERSENDKPLSAIRGEVETDFNERAKAVSDRSDTKQINAFRDAVILHYENTYKIKWPTELDMMVKVCEYENLRKKGLKVIPVDTQMQPDEKGNLTKRPNTRDTIVSFKNDYAKNIVTANDVKISVMATSSQPHIPYQIKPIEDVLGGEKFNIEVVGKGLDAKSYKIREAFDALARSIFAGLNTSLGKIIALHKSKEEGKSSPREWQSSVAVNTDTKAQQVPNR